MNTFRPQQILHKDLKNITIARTLRDFGGHLVEIFVPLLLLQSGLSIAGVCGFYLLYAVMKLSINFMTMQLINNRGARFGLFAARMSYVAYLITLFVVAQTHIIAAAWVAPLFLALTNSFQWNSEHLYLSRALDSKRRGRDLARMESITILINTFAPLVSGLIAVWLGTGWPLVPAIFFIFLSAVWVRKIDAEAGGHRRQESLSYTLTGANPRDLLANFSFNFHTAIGVTIWPIFLAVVLTSAFAISLTVAISGIVTIIFLEVIGKRNDAKGAHKLLVEGSVATFIVHALRPLALSAALATTINILWMIALRYQQNPWVSLYYAHAKKSGLDYILSMEIAGDIANIAAFSLLLVLVITLPTTLAFSYIFFAAAVVSLGCILIRPSND